MRVCLCLLALSAFSLHAATPPKNETVHGKVVVNRAMSLDGFIAAPGHSVEWGAGRTLADFVGRKLIGEQAAATGAMLVGRRTSDVGARMEDVVTFHDGCHALRELGIRSAPRRLLAHVKGLELREMVPAEECCGFGGTFSVKFAELSGAMARTKIEAIVGTGARTVVSLDPSCLMQIQGALSRAGLPVRTMHLAEVLASR